MRIGLPSFQGRRHLSLDWMLRNPLLAEASAPDGESRAAFSPTRH